MGYFCFQVAMTLCQALKSGRDSQAWAECSMACKTGLASPTMGTKAGRHLLISDSVHVDVHQLGPGRELYPACQ